MNRSTLLQAANRLAGVVKTIKTDQLAATGAGSRPLEDIPTLHPQEAWARRFAFHPMRAGRDICLGAPPLSSFVAPIAEAPWAAPRAEPIPAALPKAQVFQASHPASGRHIGSGLGKPAPRRSWLARLLRPR